MNRHGAPHRPIGWGRRPKSARFKLEVAEEEQVGFLATRRSKTFARSMIVHSGRAVEMMTSRISPLSLLTEEGVS
jgi:hypothetical protein